MTVQNHNCLFKIHSLLFPNTIYLSSKVSIRPTTGINPLYTTIATVTMNLIVAVAIVLLNLYVIACISY